MAIAVKYQVQWVCLGKRSESVLLSQRDAMALAGRLRAYGRAGVQVVPHTQIVKAPAW